LGNDVVTINNLETFLSLEKSTIKNIHDQVIKEKKKTSNILETVLPVKEPKKLEAFEKQWNDFQVRALANTQPLEMSQSHNVIIHNAEQYSDEQLAEEAKKSIKENQQREETEQIP
jgi:hypothetical protein